MSGVLGTEHKAIVESLAGWQDKNEHPGKERRTTKRILPQHDALSRCGTAKTSLSLYDTSSVLLANLWHQVVFLLHAPLLQPRVLIANLYEFPLYTRLLHNGQPQSL